MSATREELLRTDLRDSLVLTARRLSDVRSYLERLPENLQKPRHSHDASWQHGAMFIRDQVLDILERNYETRGKEGDR